MAALEESFPTLFFTTHRYSPLSVLLEFVMVNCLFSSKKLIRELSLVLIGDPFLVHDIVSTGLPVASQDKVTFFPSVTLTPCG